MVCGAGMPGGCWPHHRLSLLDYESPRSVIAAGERRYPDARSVRVEEEGLQVGLFRRWGVILWRKS